MHALSVDGTPVETLVEPETVAELVEIVADLDRAGGHALIVGGGTRLAFGNVGGPFDVAISTRRLRRILQYEPDDLTLAVEPGCTIAELADVLAGRGQGIALDAARADRSTIGGAYATGMSGPRRLAGGAIKDWVIGVETVGPDGALAKAGGMVVKNVTGYDMMHVHHGALGAFGIVTRLNLKVFPLPGPPRSVVLTYQSALSAHAAGLALLTSQLQPGSLLVTNDNGWTLRVRCDAPPLAIDRHARRIVDTAAAAATPEAIEISDDPRAAVAPFLDCTNLVDHAAVARLSVPASRQGALLERLTGRDGQRVCADVGSGLVYVAGTATTEWVADIRSCSAPYTFLALPPDLKRGLDVFGEMNDASAAIVRRLKHAFDPQCRFNRGRFALHV